MTLIHDYDGDPNQTYYDSNFLAPGWLPEDPTWSVHTAEESYQGVINVTKATTVSDNTVFAQLAADLGWAKLDATAHAMGITSQLTGNPAEVIGGLADCCTMLEMADAYATLANGGSHVPTHDHQQGRVPERQASSTSATRTHTRVFTDGEAYEGTQVLKTVIQSGTGTAANYGCPAAGKTGTAENLRQRLVRRLHAARSRPRSGSATRRATCPMSDGFGGTLAAPIWHDFMEAASNGYCGDFPQPTVPFTGTAFTGPHSASREPPPSRHPGPDRAGHLHQPEPLRPAASAGTQTTTTQTGGQRPSGRCRRQRRAPVVAAVAGWRRWRAPSPPLAVSGRVGVRA